MTPNPVPVRRFFSPDSFWNTPIGPAPRIDPRSGHFLDLLAGECGGPFWINIEKYTIPVYEADEATPLVTVRQLEPGPEFLGMTRRWPGRRTFFRHGPGFGAGVPIPEWARVDAGTDKHLAVVDWRRGVVWDMWHAVKQPDGQWASFTGMTYRVDGSGVWSEADFGAKDGESIHFYGPGRAAGVPVVAGLIMVDEVRAGRIMHKLACATFHGAYKEFVAPATWTDGQVRGGLPEGAVLQLDPALDPADFGLSPAGSVIFRCLQEYGMVNVDGARANTLYAEGCWAQPSRSWDGLLTQEEFYKVPLSCYRVLALGAVTAGGDCALRE